MNIYFNDLNEKAQKEVLKSMKTEFKKLQRENNKIRDKIKNILSAYMMSEEVEDTIDLINELINNEIEQEKLI